MICPKCGKQLPDDASFCLQCGAKIKKNKKKVPKKDQNSVKSQKYDKNYKKLSKKKTIFILSGIGTAILLIIVFFTILNPYIKYQSAMQLYNTKHYNNAMTIFHNLGAYCNSKTMVTQCKYNQAKELLNTKKYQDAIKLFAKLGNYKDSNDLSKSANYLLAKEDYDNRDYESAINIYTKLDNYKDCKTLLQESHYQEGLRYHNTSDFKNAIKEFTITNSYKDSNSLLTDSIYQEAIQEYKAGTFSSAQALFNKVSNYKDSAQQLSNVSLLLKYQGTWKFGDEQELVFNGWKVTSIIYPNGSNYSSNTFDLTLNGSYLTDSFDNYTINGNQLIDTSADKYHFLSTYTKLNNSTTVPGKKSDPAIGMTEQQVLDSSWGKPQKINKTTTANVIHEQWCYADNEYIYFDNGVVTAIQN